MTTHIPRSDTDYRVTIDQIGRLEHALLSVRESPVASLDAVDVIALIQYQEIARLRAELDAVLGFDNGASLPGAARAHFDLAQIRLPKTESDGSIPISAGARIIRESRNMLLAAACSASYPQPAFSVRRHAHARRYVKDVRLSQTERGSFVINLLSPVRQSLDDAESVEDGLSPMSTVRHSLAVVESVELELIPPPPIRQPPDGADETFPRRAARKLASGLKALREAADFSNGGSNFTAFEEMVEDGVSANLCEAVGKMVGKRNPVEIEISVKWALAIPPPKEDGAPILFSGPDARILDEASKILKKRHESHLS